MSAPDTPYVILVVENDPDHVALVEPVFQRRDPNAAVRVAWSAEEAMAFLQGPWPDTDWGRAQPPDIIVLDLLMPGMGGLGFLEWSSIQDALADVPVVVFVTLEDPQVAARCVALGAKRSFTRPPDVGCVIHSELACTPGARRGPGWRPAW